MTKVTIYCGVLVPQVEIAALYIVVGAMLAAVSIHCAKAFPENEPTYLPSILKVPETLWQYW